MVEKSITLARENKFIQEEAIANECAAKFWMTIGNNIYAMKHIQDAHQCYKKWGATTKAKQLFKQKTGIDLDELQEQGQEKLDQISTGVQEASSLVNNTLTQPSRTTPQISLQEPVEEPVEEAQAEQTEPVEIEDDL